MDSESLRNNTPLQCCLPQMSSATVIDLFRQRRFSDLCARNLQPTHERENFKNIFRLHVQVYLSNSCATCKTQLRETACKLHIITHPARFHYVIKESFTRLQHFFLSLLALPVLYGVGAIYGYNLDKLKIKP